MPAVPITSSEQYEKAIEVLTRMGGTWQGVGRKMEEILCLQYPSQQYAKAIEVLDRVGGAWQGVGMHEWFLLVSQAQYKALVEANVTTEKEVERAKNGKSTKL